MRIAPCLSAAGAGTILSVVLVGGCISPATQNATQPAIVPDTVAEESGTRLYIVGDGVRLRDGPGTNHRIVGTIKRGDPVRVLHGAGAWCAIALEADTVWVHANLVGSLDEAQGR